MQRRWQFLGALCLTVLLGQAAQAGPEAGVPDDQERVAQIQEPGTTTGTDPKAKEPKPKPAKTKAPAKPKQPPKPKTAKKPKGKGTGTEEPTASRKGSTELHRAVAAADVEAVRKALASEEVNAVNNEGRTALHLAAQGGEVDVLGVLLGAGADVSICDYRGDTPLHLAAQNGKAAAVKALLESGAQVGVADQQGDTPLHLAAKEGYEEAVTALIEAGADVAAVNKTNQKPVDLAQKYRHGSWRDVERTLEQKEQEGK